MEIATMHDMSNTRKEIAARLGFAAKEVFAADKRTTAGALRKALKAKGITSAADLEWHGISASDSDSTPYWLYEDGSMEKIKSARAGAKTSFAADKRTTAGALRKALKAKGITSADDLEWHGISAKDPDSTPYWLYEDGSMEKIKASRPGAKAEFAEQAEYRPGQNVTVVQGNKSVKGVIVKRNDMDGDIYYMVDLPNPLYRDGRTMPQRIAAWKISASRPGTKTRMTREQTEEQKAGLKIMSAADPAVGAKIATLIKEGKPQDQAVAIALDMKRRGEL